MGFFGQNFKLHSTSRFVPQNGSHHEGGLCYGNRLRDWDILNLSCSLSSPVPVHTTPSSLPYKRGLPWERIAYIFFYVMASGGLYNIRAPIYEPMVTIVSLFEVADGPTNWYVYSIPSTPQPKSEPYKAYLFFLGLCCCSILK